MKANFIYIILSSILLNSCSSTPNSSTGKKEFSNIVANESGGKINVESFDKKNGMEVNNLGRQMYSMEFSASIKFIETAGKTWDYIMENAFQTFQVTKPQGDFESHTFGNIRGMDFYAGAKVNVEGELHFEKTDNGWRVADYKIKHSEIVANEPYVSDEDRKNADKFIGTWSVKGSYPWNMPNKIIIERTNNNKFKLSYDDSNLGQHIDCDFTSNGDKLDGKLSLMTGGPDSPPQLVNGQYVIPTGKVNTEIGINSAEKEELLSVNMGSETVSYSKGH